MTGLTVPGFILLLGLAVIGVVALVKWHKNKKDKWIKEIMRFGRIDKGIPASYYYRQK